jgi:alkylation response protein AidB-like acyl-CoA dehydrogenase
VGLAEAGFQASPGYARERLQMRALTGPQNLDGPADPIIVHPDVRRMLLTQKAFLEGGRALTYYAAAQADVAEFGPPDERAAAETMLSFLTPIVKAFVTETAFERQPRNLGVPAYGLHSRNRRRTPCATAGSVDYEGTTQIQALDLVGRKPC